MWQIAGETTRAGGSTKRRKVEATVSVVAASGALCTGRMRFRTKTVPCTAFNGKHRFEVLRARVRGRELASVASVTSLGRLLAAPECEVGAG